MRYLGDTFDERRLELLKECGLSGPPTEDDVRVSKMSFSNSRNDEGQDPLVVEAGQGTFIGCLYAQQLSKSSDNSSSIYITPTRRGDAIAFFGSDLVAQTRADPSRHRTIAGFLFYDHLNLTFR